MPIRYFLSKTPHIKVYAGGGKTISWETKDGLIGYFSTEDEEQIAALDEAIKKKVGGLVESTTQEDFEAWSKKVEGLPMFRAEGETLTGPERVMQDSITPKHKATSPPVPPNPSPAAAGGTEAAVAETPAPASTAPVTRKKGGK